MTKCYYVRRISSDEDSEPRIDGMVITKAVHHTKRAVKIVVGFVVLLAGIIMLVTPGPGWAAIAVGLAILATEFHWAARLLERLKQEGGRLVHSSWVKRFLARIKQHGIRLRAVVRGSPH